MSITITTKDGNVATISTTRFDRHFEVFLDGELFVRRAAVIKPEAGPVAKKLADVGCVVYLADGPNCVPLTKKVAE